MEAQSLAVRSAIAFLAPAGTSAISPLLGQRGFARCGRFRHGTRPRPRSVHAPARIVALGAAPAPPPPEPDAEGDAAAAEQPAAPEAPAEEPVPEEVTADDILNSPSFLKKKLEIVQKELIEVRDAAAKAEDAVKDEKASYVRLAADFENYRRRSADDMRKLETKSTAKVCKAILEVLDNFDRADAAVAAVAAETDREVAIQKSYRAINKQLVDALIRLKVEPLDAVGTRFDPELHEAIQQRESMEYPEGVVCEQYSKGYVIGDSLIRAATVAVSTGPGPETVETEEIGDSNEVDKAYEADKASANGATEGDTAAVANGAEAAAEEGK